MSRILALILLAAGGFGYSPSAIADSPSELLEKGISFEETKEDLQQAMTIYRQILADAAANRPLIARAQFRLGQCLLKEGRRPEAVAAFEKLITDFPDQKNLVAKARRHLPARGALELAATPWQSGETLRMRLMTAAGIEIGTIAYMMDRVQVHDQPAWQVRSITSLGSMHTASQVDATLDTFLPISSWWRQAVFGIASAKYTADQSWSLLRARM